MRMNRRNVIVGLGTIVAGGGAALGTGAFSTATANRTLKVNVVTGENIADDLVDVLLKPGGHASVGLESKDPSNLFPTANDDPAYDSYPTTGTDVSLIDNDVTIVIGTTDNNLPPNSTVSYEPLFAVVNDAGGGPYDVEFSSDTTNTSLSFEGASGGADYSSPQTVNEDSSEEINMDVTTGDSSDTDGTLTITITE